MLIEMTFFLLKHHKATRGRHTTEHIVFKQISKPKQKTNEQKSLGGTKNSQWHCISYCGGCKCIEDLYCIFGLRYGIVSKVKHTKASGGINKVKLSFQYKIYKLQCFP